MKVSDMRKLWSGRKKTNVLLVAARDVFMGAVTELMKNEFSRNSVRSSRKCSNCKNRTVK
jgi:hypothetical protein